MAHMGYSIRDLQMFGPSGNSHPGASFLLLRLRKSDCSPCNGFRGRICIPEPTQKPSPSGQSKAWDLE